MPPSEAKGPYATGYGKPPKHSQFKKGQSGNKQGRPRGSKNIAALWRDALQVKVKIIEDGKSRKISKIEAAFTQLLNRGAAGDLRAILTLFKVLKESDELKVSHKKGPTVIKMTFPPLKPGKERSRDKNPFTDITPSEGDTD